jgi:hypothetical protein
MKTSIRLVYDSHKTETSRPDPEDRWDRGNTRSEWTIKGLEIVEKESYDSFEMEGEVKKGDEFWVVYAIWSTGDSFGQDEDGRFEVLCINKSRDLAEANYQIYDSMESYGYGAEDVGHFVTTDSGEKVPAYAPWFGYFENLSELVWEKHTVG